VKAAVYYEAGGPEVFRVEEVPDPVIGPDDVLIRVEAVSIEGGDTLHRLRGELAAAPHIVGYQCAGTVLDVGINVAGFTAGDRAVTVGADGSHAELRATRESLCWLIPDRLSTEEAACVPVAFGTAHDCLFEFGRLQAREIALIHAGASGVGLAAIQLASRAGARVVATASSDERLQRLREYGLDDGINYASTDFAEAVRHLTGGRGADVIVDCIGGSNLQKSLQCLAYRGRCLTFGDAGRQTTARLDISGMRPSNQTLTGYFLGAELLVGRRAHDVIARLLDEIAAGQLRVVIDRRFPLDQAAEAHAYIESRQAFGRVLLIP
jgi:NADPH2:quinone reductase